MVEGGWCNSCRHSCVLISPPSRSLESIEDCSSRRHSSCRSDVRRHCHLPYCWGNDETCCSTQRIHTVFGLLWNVSWSCPLSTLDVGCTFRYAHRDCPASLWIWGRCSCRVEYLCLQSCYPRSVLFVFVVGNSRTPRADAIRNGRDGCIIKCCYRHQSIQLSDKT